MATNDLQQWKAKAAENEAVHEAARKKQLAANARKDEEDEKAAEELAKLRGELKEGLEKTAQESAGKEKQLQDKIDNERVALLNMQDGIKEKQDFHIEKKLLQSRETQATAQAVATSHREAEARKKAELEARESKEREKEAQRQILELKDQMQAMSRKINRIDSNVSKGRLLSHIEDVEKEAWEWNVEEVVEWLEGKRLEEVAKVFKTEKITGEVMLELTKDDLGEMGLAFGDKKRLLKAIAELREPDVGDTPKPVASATEVDMRGSDTNEENPNHVYPNDVSTNEILFAPPPTQRPTQPPTLTQPPTPPPTQTDPPPPALTLEAQPEASRRGYGSAAEAPAATSAA